MGARKDMGKTFSKLTQEEVDSFYDQWGIDPSVNPVAPGCDKTVDQCPTGSIALYCRFFTLKFYRVSFGQLHPQGVSRVLHFETFFRLAKNGDWFTFETSQIDVSLISSLVTTLGSWKDRFFWVSESVVPFKMVWRHPDAVLNELEPSEFELNEGMLKALRACPSRLRPLTEHLLVFTGVSVLWDKPNRDPLFMKGGQDDTSDIVLGDTEAIEGEDAITRTAEGRLVPGGKYVNVPNVKGFTKVSSSKPSTCRSSHRLKGPGQSSTVEHVDLSDEIEYFEDQGIEVEGKKELAVVTGKKGKSSGKKAMVFVAGGSSERSGEEPVEGNAEDVYVSNWQVKVGDNFKSSTICEDVLNHFSPPTVRSSNSAMQDDVLISRMLLGVCNLAAMLPEGVSCFRRRLHEYEELSKKMEKTKASMAAMKKDIEGFAEKEKSWVVKVHKLTKRHEIELSNEKKRMEADSLQLKANRESFNLVVAYLLHSTEFSSTLGDVYTKLLNHGKHLGFVAGYKAYESDQPQEQSSFYQPQASTIFKESVLKMERLTYPYVGDVSTCFGKPISVLHDLKPSGLNEAVCAEVLSSLSKKRSHSGDSEDTFSDIAESSLGASIEESEVVGDDGGKKKKKKKEKKGKKAKTVKAEASKSISDA
ncbi:hypothetical protein HanPI659440_Chr11g0422281 [Helianthus annuus]|nr:hypothetical protein HanPI659440_Chr11g0422281 [Helianthus annuus]